MAPPGDAPRLYFAYSLTLEPSGAPSALGPGTVGEALDVDIVYDRPTPSWGGRVAGLADRRGQSVFGLLHEVPAAHWPQVRQREATTTGATQERTVRVRRADGHVLQATAFTTDPVHSSLQGPVSERFVDALLQAAERARLPEDYLEKLTAEALLLKRVQGFSPPF
jgi:cation transport regulator ChaC